MRLEATGVLKFICTLTNMCVIAIDIIKGKAQLLSNKKWNLLQIISSHHIQTWPIPLASEWVLSAIFAAFHFRCHLLLLKADQEQNSKYNISTSVISYNELYLEQCHLSLGMTLICIAAMQNGDMSQQGRNCLLKDQQELNREMGIGCPPCSTERWL